MDSGNSGSLQSSSGGEEYDSRAADAIFMPSHVGGGAISNQLPPSLFDPFTDFTSTAIQRNSNLPTLNPNMAWPRSGTMRPDPESTPHTILRPMLSSSLPSFQAPMAAENANPGGAAQNTNQTAARNPKKRSRASRRAPTTVLTTDTANFRAMVQEFTGIPAPPFSNSSFPRTRLDLFGTRSTPAAADAGQPPLPHYLRRSFTQKVQSPAPFLSSALDAIAAAAANPPTTSTNNTSNAAASSSTPPVNYQLPIPQSSNLYNTHNPLLNSLLQTNQKFLFSTPYMPPSKPQLPSSIVLPPGGLDEYGLDQGMGGSIVGLTNLISSDHIGGNTDRGNLADAESWRNMGILRPDEGDAFQSSVNGNYGGNGNFSASSNYHGERGQDSVAATRDEGTVESWIFSSVENQ